MIILKPPVETPIINGKNAKEILSNIVLHLVELRDNGHDYNDLALSFEYLIPQIDKIARGWSADRGAGTDGSIIFLGTVGHVLVIDKQGLIWKGVLAPSAIWNGEPAGVELTNEGKLQPNYDNLKRLG